MHLKSQLHTCIKQPYGNIPLIDAMENDKKHLRLSRNFQNLRIYEFMYM